MGSVEVSVLGWGLEVPGSTVTTLPERAGSTVPRTVAEAGSTVPPPSGCEGRLNRANAGKVEETKEPRASMNK